MAIPIGCIRYEVARFLPVDSFILQPISLIHIQFMVSSGKFSRLSSNSSTLSVEKKAMQTIEANLDLTPYKGWPSIKQTIQGV